MYALGTFGNRCLPCVRVCARARMYVCVRIHVYMYVYDVNLQVNVLYRSSFQLPTCAHVCIYVYMYIQAAVFGEHVFYCL